MSDKQDAFLSGVAAEFPDVPGDSFQLSIEANLPDDLESGQYRYTMDVLSWYGSDPSLLTFDGTFNFTSRNKWRFQ